jgi:hypothetical protein
MVFFRVNKHIVEIIPILVGEIVTQFEESRARSQKSRLKEIRSLSTNVKINKFCF